ncbi:MAG TPA: pyridoxamine 5'-phosphate oxidase family protein [Acidimicrobiales bacterium]|nr:pyridoxamine 5'-phosphate oxidase family protein [Acidimicrobiales bacterium]
MSTEKPERLDMARLRDEPNLWLATARPDGRPHLTPIWFVFVDGRFYVCTTSKAVKTRNVTTNGTASVSLESGNQPMIAEGVARVIERPYPQAVAAEFLRKFDWDLDSEPEYDVLIEVTPTRWLRW